MIEALRRLEFSLQFIKLSCSEVLENDIEDLLLSLTELSILVVSVRVKVI